MVGENDELSHEGELFGFAASKETEVERFEDWVVAGGNERGHVKDRADLGAAAENLARTAELATVEVKAGAEGVSLWIPSLNREGKH